MKPEPRKLEMGSRSSLSHSETGCQIGGARRKNSGFTLIELLVVIAIIAILAAILLPTLAKAKEKGRQSQCLNNFKQLLLAVRMYEDENQNYYPPVQESIQWPGTLWDNYKNLNVLVCPTQLGQYPGGWASYQTIGPSASQPADQVRACQFKSRSYIMNGWDDVTGRMSGAGGGVVRDTQIKYSCDTVIFGELRTTQPDFWMDILDVGNNAARTIQYRRHSHMGTYGDSTQALTGIPREGANFGQADGSARYRRLYDGAGILNVNEWCVDFPLRSSKSLPTYASIKQGD